MSDDLDLPAFLDRRSDAAKARAAEGFVYCIRNERAATAKIGWSTNPEARLSAFQTAHHDPLRLVARIPTERSAEAGLQATFSDLRLHGEWFDDSENEVSEVFIELERRFGVSA